MMPDLRIEPRLADPDRVYQRLVDLHDGLDDAASLRANARLVLILLNHIGDTKIALAAIDLAQRTGPAGAL